MSETEISAKTIDAVAPLTREAIIEAMARAMKPDHFGGGELSDGPYAADVRGDCRSYALRALAAISKLAAVVPREADADLSTVGGETEGMAVVNDMVRFYQLRCPTQVCFPGRGFPLQQAYRAMVSAADLTQERI